MLKHSDCVLSLQIIIDATLIQLFLAFWTFGLFEDGLFNGSPFEARPAAVGDSWLSRNKVSNRTGVINYPNAEVGKDRIEFRIGFHLGAVKVSPRELS